MRTVALNRAGDSMGGCSAANLVRANVGKVLSKSTGYPPCFAGDVFLRRSLAALHPATWRPVVQATRTLWFDYGHLRTVLHRNCLDAAERPIPWYTYPAVEYLKQLDFSRARVFEYG